MGQQQRAAEERFGGREGGRGEGEGSIIIKKNNNKI
jgi:hypothetical protein